MHIWTPSETSVSRFEPDLHSGRLRNYSLRSVRHVRFKGALQTQSRFEIIPIQDTPSRQEKPMEGGDERTGDVESCRQNRFVRKLDRVLLNTRDSHTQNRRRVEVKHGNSAPTLSNLTGGGNTPGSHISNKYIPTGTSRLRFSRPGGRADVTSLLSVISNSKPC
ncbi:hypothetical protein P154DRAFT_205041 [Amniculicola lignicola CBS 123094]|uniref:Uncharacterized protein n=1 Tax=Amniculicola lignicola CBS 123094 TaxID=1392246 RepID=A0A6A5WGS1_9PLEO|nr:hypothetical protein P154DRAFT_205041 [Amniculicola lignicola CBS 123094]